MGSGGGGGKVAVLTIESHLLSNITHNKHLFKYTNHTN